MREAQLTFWVEDSVTEILYEKKTLKRDLKDENELAKSRMKGGMFQIQGLLKARASG